MQIENSQNHRIPDSRVRGRIEPWGETDYLEALTTWLNPWRCRCWPVPNATGRSACPTANRGGAFIPRWALRRNDDETRRTFWLSDGALPLLGGGRIVNRHTGFASSRHLGTKTCRQIARGVQHIHRHPPARLPARPAGHPDRRGWFPATGRPAGQGRCRPRPCPAIPNRTPLDCLKWKRRAASRTAWLFRWRASEGFIVFLAACPAVKCLAHQTANISELPSGSCASLVVGVPSPCRLLSPNSE